MSGFKPFWKGWQMINRLHQKKADRLMIMNKRLMIIHEGYTRSAWGRWDLLKLLNNSSVFWGRAKLNTHQSRDWTKKRAVFWP